MNDGQDDSALPDELTACEELIGYRFHDRRHLQLALTHTSAAKTRTESNERLEFLGDAILGAIVCSLLYRTYTTSLEGELTRLKSMLVSRSTCARVGQRWGFEQFLIMGKGLSSEETLPSSILAGVVESLIGACYLDGGIDAARSVVMKLMEDDLSVVTDSTEGKNYKSLLQQIAQKHLNETPVYRLLDEQGPDHSKCFKVSAVVGHRIFPAAWGPNKKEAEQRAAQNALDELEGRDDQTTNEMRAN
ncbi:MAG: ribonuclease III [Planctomycetota bacterium]|nr:ribonuclease III [Planctomycetota bacterium]